MAKTLFENGTPITPELLNKLNNPTYAENPSNDGEIPYPPARALADEAVTPEKLSLEPISDSGLGDFLGFEDDHLVRIPRGDALRWLKPSVVKRVGDRFQLPPEDLNYTDHCLRVISVTASFYTAPYGFTFLESRGPINTETPIIIVSGTSTAVTVIGPDERTFILESDGWLMVVPTGVASYQVLVYARGGLIESDQIVEKAIIPRHLSPSISPTTTATQVVDFSPELGVAYFIDTYDGASETISIAASLPIGSSTQVMGLPDTGEKFIQFPNPDGVLVSVRIASAGRCCGVRLTRFRSGYIFDGGC